MLWTVVPKAPVDEDGYPESGTQRESGGRRRATLT
jgi:hypothetical protein